uniref:Gypsy retrotransposon integrase-like protein 1 n=1 Tax=Oryzias latipes TaxID=8090 RepID=A0A3B3I7K6_ORYLA
MADDPTMNMLKDTIYKGWPQYRKQCPLELWEYWTFRCDLVLEDGLILKGKRIVIPKALRNDILDILHTGHQGETKCILLARESVFWPGISSTIREMVKGCHVCSMFQPAQQKLPIMQPDLPTRPWEILGSDIFEFDSHKYLIIVDYSSRFPVVRLLPDISARTVCTYFKSVLGEHGLPSTIIADCDTQYVSEEFKKRYEDSNITLKFSSPCHHQANSVAERAVGTVKALWKKAKRTIPGLTQHCGCTEEHHWMTTCHHHMSYQKMNGMETKIHFIVSCLFIYYFFNCVVIIPPMVILGLNLFVGAFL